MVILGFAMTIKNEKTFIITYEDKTYEFEILSYVVDEVNQLLTFITDKSWRGHHNVENEQEIHIYKYLCIYEGNEVKNILLYEGNYDDYHEEEQELYVYWQNGNGVKADIAGTFVDETGEKKLILNPDEIENNYIDTWTNSIGAYLKINGYYWISVYFGDWEPLIIQDENTIEFNGTIYTKQVSN